MSEAKAATRPGPGRRRARAGISRAVVVGLLAFLPAFVPASRASAQTAAPVDAAQVARLRAELERANADVAALKRGPRTVTSDYRLRQRMADAEALARRLTDAEARLRREQGTRVGVPAAPVPVAAAASDGPAELEAKADILSDQARRLAVEAERLQRSAESLRGRETLRRRMGRLERDPFVSFDASKRSLAVGASTGSRDQFGGRTTEGSSQEGVSRDDSAAPAVSPPVAPQDSTKGESSPPPVPTSGWGPAPTGAPSVTYRTFLDQITLSDVRRLEAEGTPAARAEAMARAAEALRLRAQSLESESRSLRARAKP